MHFQDLLYVGDGRGECLLGERDDIEHERSDDDISGWDVLSSKNAALTHDVAIVNAL